MDRKKNYVDETVMHLARPGAWNGSVTSTLHTKVARGDR